MLQQTSFFTRSAGPAFDEADQSKTAREAAARY